MSGAARDVGVVIVAGGSSTRTIARAPVGDATGSTAATELKQLRWVAGKPMLLHSLQTFQQRADVAMVVCVLPNRYAGDPPPWIFQCDMDRMLISVGGAIRGESVHRFRCERFACQWAGNLRVGDKSAGTSVLPEADNSLFNPVSAGVPRTFIGSMVLAAAGIVTVILAPMTDLVGNDSQAYLEPSDYQVSVAHKLERVSAQPQRDAGSARVEQGGIGSGYFGPLK